MERACEPASITGAGFELDAIHLTQSTLRRLTRLNAAPYPFSRSAQRWKNIPKWAGARQAL